MHEELPHFMQGYQLAVRIIDDVDHASTGAHGKVIFSYRLFCLDIIDRIGAHFSTLHWVHVFLVIQQ
jgi:hypothetical protein